MAPPGGNLKTRTRDDGTVMVQIAPGRWTSRDWWLRNGGGAIKDSRKTSPQPTSPNSVDPSRTSLATDRKVDGAGRVSGTPEVRKGEVGRAGRAGEAGERRPLPLPAPMKRGRQPRGAPNPKREAVLDRFAATDDSHGDIADATGAARGSIGVWIAEARRAGDARVKAGDRRRGRG